MRVLMICNYKPGVGGISGQVELLQKKLKEEGHAVEVFSTKASAWKRLWMLPKLCRQAKSFDVLHIHCCSDWGFLPAVMGVRAGKKLGKRIVLTYHGGGGEVFFDKHPRLVRKYLTQTDANIVLSGFLARVFEKHGLPYTIIPNIIELDSSCFQLREVIRPNYISIRAHEPLYNIPCILKAFQKVQTVLPEARLTVVGDGSQHQQLMHEVELMGLRNVVFTGRVDNKDIYHYLDQCDVMLSAPTADNMPVSLLEAMNAGLLVIASSVGGVPYLIEDNETGLLFESDNPEELAEKMLWAVNHNERVKEILIQANQKVRDYRWENVRNRLLSVYGQ